MTTEEEFFKIDNTNQYLEIWKFFSQRKEELQQRLYSFITWSTAALIGFIGFMLKNWKSLSEILSSLNYFFWSVIIFWICLTVHFSLKIYHHEKKNEDRQKRAAKYIPQLKDIIDGNSIICETEKNKKNKKTLKQWIMTIFKRQQSTSCQTGKVPITTEM